MPSTWPAQMGWRGNGVTAASNSANLMLDEPQLSTRIGSLAGRANAWRPRARSPLGAAASRCW
jgi:hypothetical protein